MKGCTCKFAGNIAVCFCKNVSKFQNDSLSAKKVMVAFLNYAIHK